MPKQNHDQSAITVQPSQHVASHRHGHHNLESSLDPPICQANSCLCSRRMWIRKPSQMGFKHVCSNFPKKISCFCNQVANIFEFIFNVCCFVASIFILYTILWSFFPCSDLVGLVFSIFFEY